MVRGFNRHGWKTKIILLGPLKYAGERIKDRMKTSSNMRMNLKQLLPLLLLLALRHPLLKAVLGVDQSFTGITHRAS